MDRTSRFAIVLAGLLAACPFGASAQTGTSAPTQPVPAPPAALPWAVEFSGEQAPTTNYGVDSTWTTQRFQVSWARPDVGGWAGGVERQERYGFVDVAAYGQAYKRAGDWTYIFAGGGTPNAHFLYQASGQAEVARRIGGTWVAAFGYRYLKFPAVEIHQIQPAVTWYHSRGELEMRAYVTHNMLYNRNSPAGMVRTYYDFTRRFRLGGGGSYGDRIFDVSSLATGQAHTRAGFAEMRVGFTPQDFVVVSGMLAHEEPSFDYRSYSFGYRRVF